MDPDLLKEHGSGYNDEVNARTLETDEVSMSGSHKPEEEIMGSSPNDPKGRLSRQHTYEIVVDDGYNTLVSECPVSRLPEHCGDNVEGEILLVDSEEASCSDGSSEEYLEEFADTEDSDDKDEEGSYNRFHQLPEPVPTIKVAPVKSPLQLRFPNLNLPSSHAAYLLQPADKFQPHDKFLAALTDMGISSRAATKALFWTGNCCLQTAAEWCFSNPGREMELLSLEEEVAMWLQDLEIQEAEIEAYQAALLREMMVVEEEERQMRMRMLQSRNMQMGNRLEEVVESGEKHEGEVIVIEDDQCGGSRSQQVFLSPGGDMDSSEEEEDYLDIPGVVLFINFKAYAWDGLEEEALQNLVIELFHKANDENEEYFYLWNENNLEYEIRLVEDEEALLEKREVASDELLVGEDQVMVEKWVGGQEEEGSPSVRTFVAMALMARLGVVEELVANTHLCEVARL